QHVLRDRDVAEEADAELVPRRRDRKDGDATIDQGAPRNVPPVVVVVQVEASERHQHAAATELEPVLDVVLHPDLLERDLGGVGGSVALLGREPALCGSEVLLHLELAEALELELKYALSRGAMLASPARTKRRSSNEFLSAGLSVPS